MNIHEFEIKLVSYCKEKVAPKLKTDFDRFLMYGALGVLDAAVPSLMRKYGAAMQDFGVIDAEGKVNIDLLEKFGTSAFEGQPTLNIWKITFEREDFDKFIEHLRG